MTEDVRYMPVVSFPDQSPSFVHGFEAGMIWQQMQDGLDPIEPEIAVQRANREVFENMANSAGYNLDTEEYADTEWMTVKFTRQPKRRGHLSVVADNSDRKQ